MPVRLFVKLVAFDGKGFVREHKLLLVVVEFKMLGARRHLIQSMSEEGNTLQSLLHSILTQQVLIWCTKH